MVKDPSKDAHSEEILVRFILNFACLIGGAICIGSIYGWKVGLGVVLLILFLK